MAPALASLLDSGEALDEGERRVGDLATYCAEDSSPIGEALIEFHLVGDAAIRERFERALAEGDLPAEAHPEELTDFIRTVVYGMAVQAASGATRNELERVIQYTMRGWPQ